MSWQREAREAGIDPRAVEDGQGTLEVIIPDYSTPLGKKMIKGARIGVGSECVGARCALWSIPGAEWVYVGARVAIVFYENGKLLRYEHTGIIPKNQDAGFYPKPGTYALKMASPSRQLGQRRLVSGKGDGTGHSRHTTPKRSLAAQLRG